ncbi:MAG: hypothetical protein HPY65_17970 [Syntrophaceae bacterium]|nr:hypothetical protein [Syntrophaceae bacterium]
MNQKLFIKIYETARNERYRFLFWGFTFGFVISLSIKESMFLWVVFGAFLSVVFSIIYEFTIPWAKKIYLSAKLSKLLGPMFESRDECIIFITEFKRDITEKSLQDYKGHYVVATSRLIGSGDAEALPYLYNLLLKARKPYDKIRLVRSFENVNDYYTSNFISIGGLTNRVTRSLMESHRDVFDYYFSKNGRAIIKKYDSYYKYIENSPRYDYGIITKVSNLNHQGRVIIIVAGISDMGTAGAAFHLFDNCEKIVDEYGESDFSIVVQVSKEIGAKSAREFNFEKESRECVEE